jgi:pimeloyl-[acyl-carrier protein] methyl ester esterase
MKMVVLLLPGMDGTGILFEEFVRLLPDGVDAKVIGYPEDKYLTYEQLAERVICVLPANEPYVIAAESYSGPVAALLAAHPVGNLQAVVFVSSFVSLPCGRIGPWIVKVLPVALFRPRAPAWLLRWLLMNSTTGRELISEVQEAIARVRPEVLARRLRDALNADFGEILKACTVRIVCLSPKSDRLLGTRGLRGFLAAKPDIETVRIAGPHFLLQCAPDSSFAALQKLGLFGSPMPARRT